MTGEIRIISNSNPEVATFKIVDEQVIVHALSAGTTILVYERNGQPVPHKVNVT